MHRHASFELVKLHSNLILSVAPVSSGADTPTQALLACGSAKELIAQIQSGKPDDNLWDAKVTVLSEYVKHHVKEEQNEMFPKVRKSKIDLKALGQQLKDRKEQLMEQMGAGGDRATPGALERSCNTGVGRYARSDGDAWNRRFWKLSGGAPAQIRGGRGPGAYSRRRHLRH